MWTWIERVFGVTTAPHGAPPPVQEPTPDDPRDRAQLAARLGELEERAAVIRGRPYYTPRWGLDDDAVR